MAGEALCSFKTLVLDYPISSSRFGGKGGQYDRSRLHRTLEMSVGWNSTHCDGWLAVAQENPWALLSGAPLGSHAVVVYESLSVIARRSGRIQPVCIAEAVVVTSNASGVVE